MIAVPNGIDIVAQGVELPDVPPKPGKGPLAFRLRFTDGAGFDLTEAGTRKRLAVYLVTDPFAVPNGIDIVAQGVDREALAM